MKSFEQFFSEEKLDADDRKKLSDDDYGVIIKDKDGKVIERAYPMPDAKHVESAARMYPFAKRKYDSTVVAELRRKIIAKAKEFNVPDSKIQSVIDDNPGGKTVKESFIYNKLTSAIEQFFQEGNKTHYQRTMDRWDYDPKTNTVKTDIPDPRSTTGEPLRVKLIVDNTRGPHLHIPKDINGNKDLSKAEIHVPRKVLKTKGWNIDTIMKHEEGHLAVKYNKQPYEADFNKAQQMIDNNKRDLMGNVHGNRSEEYVVDKYAAQHSRFGKRGTAKALQRTFAAALKASKASTKQINAIELLNDEIRRHKISTSDYYQKQMAQLQQCKQLLSTREGNLNALQKALIEGGLDEKTIEYCNKRIEEVKADIQRLKAELDKGCEEFDADNDKFMSDPKVANAVIERVNNFCKQMKVYDKQAKIKEGELRVAFVQNNVQEAFGPEDDDTSGTSEFDEYIVSEPDDCYTESSVKRPEFPEEFNRIFNNIIAPIGEYSDKMRKKPTGNQNCQLCVWCAEARFRGIDALPRPVYSPRDPVLEIPGEAIVYNPKKIKISSYTDVASEVTKAGNGCRIYVHVNWKDSQGGHEFILLRIEDKNYYADPQVALLGELTKHCRYFTDINYNNSYLCRLDDKEFNEKLFNKWNDPSTVVPWDESKDIPYMKENGMLEEYEESKAVQESTLPKGITLRPAEEKDLPNIIQWKLESINQDIVDNPKVIEFIKNDARENLNNTKMILCDDDTIGILESCYIDDGEWWYIGEIYLIPEYRGKGIAKALLQDEIDSHDKLKLKVSKDNDHAIKLYKSLGFIISESDEYSYVMTLVKDSVQEGFFKKDKPSQPKPCELYKQFEDAYNDETFTSIIKTFKNHESSLLSDWFKKKEDENIDGNVTVFLSKKQLTDMEMTDSKYNVIGYGFAYVNNPDEWLGISMIDGKVYICGDNTAFEYPENIVADSFNEFLASFGNVFESYLNGKHIQESWNTEESLKLFKKLPKDLQNFLKNGDISDLDEDYGIDGYVVEEFSAPEYLEIAGTSYNLKDDDPMYNAIDFATDGGGNDFVYNPDDGYYYNLDHEDYDIYDHIHGDRLSSTKWSELIDPTRKSNKSGNPNVERTLEFRIMTESHLYWDICHVVLDDEIDTKLCNKINDDYDVARKGTWHDEFFKKVDEFASKYGCSYIKEPVDEFKSFMKRDFRPTMFNWKFNIDGLKPRCMNIIKAFMKVIKELDIDTTKLNPPAYKLHKQIIAKYGTKMFQEGVIQNIKNKTSPFEKNLVYHISPDGHLDGQVFKPRVPDYLDKYDPSKTEFEDVETPRVCFSPSIEGCLNAILVNIGRWKTAEKLRDWYVYIPEKSLKEYKYRTNKQLVDEKKVYDANITKEIWIEEPVRLKQYGIIRIDSVVDKNRKKAVPTTTGESKKRNVYDFKWHWLVKPKVLKDVPYNYSPLEVCKDMVDVLSEYKYGIPENGRIVSGSEHDYDTKWKLQSPEEFEKNRGGICYDYVEFEEGYLDAYGIKCKKYYMSTNLPGNDTHTFILVEDGKGGYIYPESSFKDAEGVHEVKSIEEACKIVVNGFWKINNNRKNTDSFEWHVWEYTGHPAYGSNMDTCMKYYCGWNDKTKQPKNPIYEGVAKDDDPKPIKESFSYFARFVNDFKNNKE